jgi:Asp-tRNA(Asn)/Glu-tRNA(Gln) amidotransferase A subunit family amidase
VVPLSWTYDHVGPLTRTVEDASVVLQAISDWKPEQVDVRKLRIGVAREYFFEGVDPQIATAVEQVIQQLGKECASVREVKVPIDEDRTVSSAESWQYHKPWVETKPELYQPQTLTRIRSGEKYTAEQIEARRRELEKMRTSASDLFRDVDVIVSPTSPILPPRLDDLLAHPETLRPNELLMLRNTRPWNVLGVPALSIPCGNMMGVQLAGLREGTLVAVGKALSK